MKFKKDDIVYALIDKTLLYADNDNHIANGIMKAKVIGKTASSEDFYKVKVLKSFGDESLDVFVLNENELGYKPDDLIEKAITTYLESSDIDLDDVISAAKRIRDKKCRYNFFIRW